MDSKYIKWQLLLLLSLIWGSSFILIKKGLIGLSAFELGSLRIIFAAFFVLIIGFKSLTTIPSHKWKYIALTGIVGSLLPVYLFSFAQTHINSSISAILNSLTPLFTLLLGVILFQFPFKRSQLIGVIIGLIGCIVLIYNGMNNSGGQNYFYTLFVILGSICYALNLNFIKKYLSDVSPLSITTGNFAFLLIPALVGLFFTDFFSIVGKEEVQLSMGYILILGIVGTGLSNVLYFRLIQISSPIFASSVTYMIPIVAIMWGLLDLEVLTPVQLIGAGIILIGVYQSSKK